MALKEMESAPSNRPEWGSRLYPVVLLLGFHVDYQDDLEKGQLQGITRPELTRLSKWPESNVNAMIVRGFKRGFFEYHGRRRPSALGRWSKLIRLTRLGRLAANELYDQGKIFGFDDEGELYLAKQNMDGEDNGER